MHYDIQLGNWVISTEPLTVTSGWWYSQLNSLNGPMLPGGSAVGTSQVCGVYGTGYDAGTIAATSFIDPESDGSFNVSNPEMFATRDLIKSSAGDEWMIVTAIAGSQLTVIRGAAGTTPVSLDVGQTLTVIGKG